MKKKPASELKNTQVKIRTTEAFKKKLDDRAWRLRLSVGEYIRTLVEEDLHLKSRRDL